MNRHPETSLEVERPILSMRRQGRILTLPVIVLIALAAASGYFVGALPEPWMNWAAGLGAIALALILGFGPLLGWLTGRTSLTSRRVIVRRGFFVHRRSEVPLSRVREVRSKRGPIQRMFGSGDIELLVGTDAPIVLRDLPEPGLVVDALQELIEENYLTDRRTEEQAWAAQGIAQGFTMPGDPGAYGDTTVLPR
ncbi:PH domain-containing protein [Leucobacter sp. UT-8R-CII-1-4]|uniref:PH domain-containing protein n=1 Tax=Leucobacter sp. UT-8R-CII-1-4 TaxID=3040075 RepID=UPI0024A82711|nr:PH domain-containing protein [Leucobacter sp. UT-8R-CII-1-4]MDI6022540.1 PH domain-containing protein [Leucobacter sp. UT-8R-CII-1-4]